jgi:cell division protein FtsN
MAHQDYVSRPRTKNNKKNPYKKKPAQVKESIGLKFKFIGLLTISLITIAGYFLWSIKDISPELEQPNSQTINQPAIAINEHSKSSSLPLPPKEKWTYVDELKSKEVEVGEYEVKNGGPYQMQCGSFRTDKQAGSLKAKIAFAGIESQVKQVKGSSGIWYKVILGPYARKRNAEKDKHKLSSNNVNHCQIWSWR